MPTERQTLIKVQVIYSFVCSCVHAFLCVCVQADFAPEEK